MPERKTENSKLTTVKTVYARAALLLLAVNFCLTTYVVVNLNKSVQDQVDTTTRSTPTVNTPATLGSTPSRATETREVTTENP